LNVLKMDLLFSRSDDFTYSSIFGTCGSSIAIDPLEVSKALTEDRVFYTFGLS
jgi:hypothetical protein